MNKKLIPLSLLLVAISSCALVNSKESIHLMDGSTLFIDGGKAVRIVDSTGKTRAVKKGALERANGSVIYIKDDGEVKKPKSYSHSNTYNSDSSGGHGGSGHSH